MTIAPKAVEAACEAYYRYVSISQYGKANDYTEYYKAVMSAALTAALPFIRAQVIEECAKVAEQGVWIMRPINRPTQAIPGSPEIAAAIRALAEEP